MNFTPKPTGAPYKLRTQPVTVAPITPVAPAPGTQPAQAGPTRNVTAAIDGLQSSAKFHYRLVAVNSAGTTMGADQTFTSTSAGRVAPLRVTARTTPLLAVTYPYRFDTFGVIVPPAGVDRARACRGFVAIRVKDASRTISLRRASIDANCHYNSHVTFRIPRRVRRGVLQVSTLFGGNAILSQRSGPRQTVYIG